MDGWREGHWAQCGRNKEGGGWEFIEPELWADRQTF